MVPALIDKETQKASFSPRPVIRVSVIADSPRLPCKCKDSADTARGLGSREDVGVFEAVVGEAADVELVGAVAAAGEADIGLARLARAVDDTADDRHLQWRRDVREALLEPLDVLMMSNGWRAQRGH